MLEYLSFELCKENGESRCLKACNCEDGFYLRTGQGYRGLYIAEGMKRYRCGNRLYPSLVSVELEELKIRKWPKAFPADYVPGKHLMGCDEGSWSLDYREEGYRNTRHIHGKGSFPDTYPFTALIRCLDGMCPDSGLASWVYGEGTGDTE